MITGWIHGMYFRVGLHVGGSIEVHIVQEDLQGFGDNPEGFPKDCGVFSPRQREYK